MLNWEMEFKKWAPGFKILTYYGSREQRAEKRKGWFDNNLWHVCITSYQLVLQDQVTFKRRNWHYLILDEAHNIKNFRSQRWQTLLNFKSEARLLLTGTPLQNNLIELWSLLYFLMPSGTTSLPTGFANLNEFQEWFAHPVEQLMEGGREGMDAEAKNTVTKLHKVLRPYLLRRLKADVEKQMPGKYEHIVYCRLSKRQRYLYDDFMSMAKTRETLASGNYLSIINCLMQLRKVCNHPDLFETRQIVTSFAMQKSVVADYEIKDLLVRRRLVTMDPFDTSISTDFLEFIGLVPAKRNELTARHSKEIRILSATDLLRQHYQEKAASIEPVESDFSTIQGNSRYMRYQSELSHLDKLKSCVQLNRIRTHYQPLCSSDLVEACSRDISVSPLKPVPRKRSQITEWFMNASDIIRGMIPTLEERANSLETTIAKFGCITPVVVATDMPQIALGAQGVDAVHRCREKYPSDPFHQPRIRLSIAFPDKRLLQYDCGKLQRLDALLRQLQAGGHRALIFTQMTKVLDILEQFLNIHGHRYLRLDGATKVEQRQALTDRFNNDTRIPVFILSTRSGGLGINLTGADTVIFYDLDWNPAMDKQCQDRCHRIGQTRDVHIYRFVSEYTIESNILRKSDQKRMLDDVVIQEGDFTTDYFNKLTIRDMLGDEVVDELQAVEDAPILPVENMEKALEAAEDLEDVAAAKVAQREVVDTDVADFAEKGTPQTPATSKDSSTPRDTSAPATTAAPTPKETVTAAAPREAFAELDVNKGLGHDIYGEGWGRVDREPEHIDDYMIRHMEWELIDVPVVILDKSKRKRNKKGKKF
jgi:helicase SWR1